MATTSGIANYYSSCYRVLPQKAIPLGTPSSVYEPIQVNSNEAGICFVQYFQITIPVGFGWASSTNYDVANLLSFGGTVSNANSNTVVPGYRLDYFELSNSANVGNALLVGVGFATANNIVNSVAGAATYLGGGSAVGTPIATITATNLQTTTPADVSGAALGGAPTTGWTVLSSISPTTIASGDTLVLFPKAVVNLTTTASVVSGWVRYYALTPSGF